MKYLVLKTDGSETEYIMESKADLSLIRQWIDGYAEPIKVQYEGQECQAYVDEDGQYKGSDYNPTATQLLQDLHEQETVLLVGNMVVELPDDA